MQPGRGVGHSDAGADGSEHFDIVVAVTEGHAVGLVDAVEFQHLFHGDALAAAGRDDIHGAVPPCGDLRVLHILQDGWVLRFPATHQHLKDLALRHSIKIVGDHQLDPADGKILRQIRVGAVSGQPVLGGQRHGPPQRFGVPAEQGNVRFRDEIFENIALRREAIGAVVGQERIESDPFELRHFHGSAAGGDAELDAVLPQFLQRLHRSGADALLERHQCAVDVKKDDLGLCHSVPPAFFLYHSTLAAVCQMYPSCCATCSIFRGDFCRLFLAHCD